MRMIVLAIIAAGTISFVGAAYWDSAGFGVAERSAGPNVRLN